MYKIGIALVLGVCAGVFFGPSITAVSYIGTTFLKLLTMLVVPLILTSMLSGITHIPSAKELGRIGSTTCILYAISTIFAVILGFVIATSVPLGSSLSMSKVAVAQSALSSAKIPQSFQEFVLSLIPTNPIRACSEQNIPQIIIFAIFFGISLNMSGARGAVIREIIDALVLVMQKMTSIVMYFAPIGVFSLIATAVGTLGLEVLIPVTLFLLLYYCACCIHAVVAFGGLLKAFTRMPVISFLYGIRNLLLTTISTCSSSASLPVALECATERLGVKKALAHFVLPLGNALNMNGSALFQVMATLFVAQAYGIVITPEMYGTLFFTCLFTTLGTANIPGAGFMGLSVLFVSLGVPLEGLALLAGVDRLRDMATTSLNVVGDVVCAVVVSELDARSSTVETETA